jgi:hypothetical protein
MYDSKIGREAHFNSAPMVIVFPRLDSIMNLHEAMFKVKHDCPGGNMSERYPSTRIFKWYNPESDVVEILAKEPKDRLSLARVFQQRSKRGFHPHRRPTWHCSDTEKN